MDPMTIIAALVGGYLLGSIPFGVLVARFGGLGDLRKIGSGNIGATNVLRTGRKDLALITLIGDALKGAAAVLIARAVTGDEAIAAIAGGAAFLGHVFPVWLKFNGGKGVATFLGVLLAAYWPVGILTCVTWAAMAKLLKFSSLSALTAAALAPFFVLFTGAAAPFLYLSISMGLLIFIRHHQNISRLLAGDEPRIGESKA